MAAEDQEVKLEALTRARPPGPDAAKEKSMSEFQLFIQKRIAPAIVLTKLHRTMRIQGHILFVSHDGIASFEPVHSLDALAFFIAANDCKRTSRENVKPVESQRVSAEK